MVWGGDVNPILLLAHNKSATNTLSLHHDSLSHLGGMLASKQMTDQETKMFNFPAFPLQQIHQIRKQSLLLSLLFARFLSFALSLSLCLSHHENPSEFSAMTGLLMPACRVPCRVPLLLDALLIDESL